MCYGEGILQAHLDGELATGLATEVGGHLVSCASCRERLAELAGNQSLVAGRLEVCDQESFQSTFSPGVGWRRVMSGNGDAGRGTGVSRGWRTRPRFPGRAAAAAAVLLLGLMVGLTSLAPIRAAAAGFLSIFRVEQLQAITISPQDILLLQNNLAAGQGLVDLQAFGKAEVSGRQEMARATLEEARDALGYEVKVPSFVPDGYGTPEVFYQPTFGVTLTLKADAVNSFLRSVGAPSLLPAEVDGKGFGIQSSGLAVMHYRPESPPSTASWRRPLVFSQAKAPEFQVPDGIDVEELRRVILDLPLLPWNIRNQLGAIGDWRRTLPVPVMEGESRTVGMGGVEAIWQEGSDGSGLLLWQLDEVVFALEGTLSLDEAVQIAQSLQAGGHGTR